MAVAVNSRDVPASTHHTIMVTSTPNAKQALPSYVLKGVGHVPRLQAVLPGPKLMYNVYLQQQAT